MFGWEFPPHISGGLGTACFGLTGGLLQHDVDVLFVVPRLFGDEDRTKFRFISAKDIGIDFTNPIYKDLLKCLSYIQISSAIIPYLSPEEYTRHSTITKQHSFSGTTISSENFDFTGHYGIDLMKEVAQYALVASQIASKNEFDIIHAHDWLTFPAGIIAKQISGKPLIIHVHATEFDRSGDNINQSVYDIEQKGMQEADSIIAVSFYTKQILIDKYGINETKIKVVHNGVIPINNIDTKKKITRKKNRVVTFLGRITFQKGPEYFVEAAKKVLEKYPDTYFVMAGNGDMLTTIIKRVAELKLSSRFYFTGFLKGAETDLMYDMSDVYVMPSVSEPFGISPLEAVRSGVPVIISKQSGVSEVLKNTIKVDFWDIDALADAICGLLNYDSLAQTFIREGNKEVEKLKWEDAAIKTKHIYQSLI